MKVNNNKKETYSVSAILFVDPYIYSEFFRLSLAEIKEKFDSWSRNNHEPISVSITFDGNEFYRVKDYDDLCWVVSHKDDKLFKYFKEYRL